MTLKFLLAVGCAISLLITAELSAQTKSKQLLVTNGTNTSKLTPSPLGLELNTALVLQSPTSPSTKLVLSIPVTSTTTYFTFPSTDGTLVSTGSANTFTATQTFPVTTAQGDALIASINAATAGTKIAAAHLDLSGSGSVSVNATLAFTGPVLGIDLSNPNNWSGTQSFPTTQSQGNNFISSINSGNTSINIARVNTSTLALAATTVTANAPLTGSGTLGANLSLGLSTNASMSTAGGTLGVNLANANTWTGTQTFSQPIAGSITGNATTATSADGLAASAAAGTSAIAAINLAGSGTVSATKGGTGQSSFAVGDLLVANTTATLSPINAASTAGYVLTSTGANSIPTWQAAPGAGSVGLNAINTFTAKQNFNGNVQFGSTSPAATVTAMLYQSQTIDFASTSAKDCSDQTFAMSNVAFGDVVTVGFPNSAVPAKGTYMAWVSSAGNITVRFCNPHNNNAYDPASGDFKILVTKVQ
jgi:hypothetical protein